MEQVDSERAEKFAFEHVEWLLDLLRPLLITEFIHGYGHGVEDATVGKEPLYK